MLAFTSTQAGNIAPADARAIARETCIYGFPMMDSYGIMHACFADRAHPEHQAQVERSGNENL